MKSWSVKALHAEVPFVMLWMVDRALEFVNKFQTCFHFKWKLLSSFYVFNVLFMFLSEVVTSVFLISHPVPNVVIQHFVTMSTYYRQGAINIRRPYTTNNSIVFTSSSRIGSTLEFQVTNNPEMSKGLVWISRSRSGLANFSRQLLQFSSSNASICHLALRLEIFKTTGTLYNLITKCLRLPRLTLREGLGTGFCAPLPRNSAALWF